MSASEWTGKEWREASRDREIVCIVVVLEREKGVEETKERRKQSVDPELMCFEFGLIGD